MNPQNDHALLMDQIYRYQRGIYDITRKYYLLGRDSIIQKMEIEPGQRVLEMGCGTARNLLILAKRNPQARFYGLDASTQMLLTARKKIEQAGLENKIVLRQCLAEKMSCNATFGLSEPFDSIFFSYSLSMIPTWREAMQAAIKNVKSEGWIYIVDFWDQAKLPKYFQRLLTWWLSIFHVKHEPELIAYLQSLESMEDKTLEIDSICGRYAFMARLQKKG